MSGLKFVRKPSVESYFMSQHRLLWESESMLKRVNCSYELLFVPLYTRFYNGISVKRNKAMHTFMSREKVFSTTIRGRVITLIITRYQQEKMEYKYIS